MIFYVRLGLLSFIMAVAVFSAGAQTTVYFYAPDTVDYWTVPAGVDSIVVVASGGPGCYYYNWLTGYPYGNNANGAEVKATLMVTPGQVLRLALGGSGNTMHNAAFNGGGRGGKDLYGYAGGGGGATDIRIGADTGLDHRVLVAGGGGGSACYYPDYSLDYTGGDAGCFTGGPGHANGVAGAGGGGGTPTAGGLGGIKGTDSAGNAGGYGYGGDAALLGDAIAGGGGGGGYYGGGAGCNGGGGAGSSYTDPSIARNVTCSPNSTFSSISITYGFGSVTAALSAPVLQAATIIPNPSAGNAWLELALSTGDRVDITITDMAGRVVWHESHNTGAGRQQILLPGLQLQSGIYLVHVSAGEQYTKTLRWVRD